MFPIFSRLQGLPCALIRSAYAFQLPIELKSSPKFRYMRRVTHTCSATTENFRKDLRNVILEVSRPDVYCVGGRIRTPVVPDLRIAALDHSQIGLPLQQDQAEALASICDQAPFGKGTETIVDLSVRNCLQLDPSQIQVAEEWDDFVQEIGGEAADGIGISGDVQANLYKLVLYPPGGFFKPHQDSEKEDGMFGTLVMQLPCEYEGGSLVVRYRDESETFDFSEDSRLGFYYSAFYTDCEHEFSEVKGGYRLTLIYNLVKTSDGYIPKILRERSSLVERVTSAAKGWIETSSPPPQISILLSHKYTEASLSFENLKGGDRAMAWLLRESGQFTLQLSLLRLHTYIGNEDLEKELDVIKSVDDREEQEKRDPCIEPDETDFLRGYVIFDKDDSPDEEEIVPNYGNESTQIDRWYFRALLIARPVKPDKSFKFDYSDYEGELTETLEKALETIEEMVSDGSEGAEKVLLENLRYARKGIKYSTPYLARFLSLAHRLESKEGIRLALGSMTLTDNEFFGSNEYVDRASVYKGCHGKEQALEIAKVLCRYGWDEFGSLVMEVVQATHGVRLEDNSCHILAEELEKAGGFEEQVVEIISATIRNAMSKRSWTYVSGEITRLLFMFPACNEVREEFRETLHEYDQRAFAIAILGAHPHTADKPLTPALRDMYRELATGFTSARPPEADNSEQEETYLDRWEEAQIYEIGPVLLNLLKDESNLGDLVQATADMVLAKDCVNTLESVLKALEGRGSDNENVMRLMRTLFRKLDANQLSIFTMHDYVKLLCRYPTCRDAVDNFAGLLGEVDYKTLKVGIDEVKDYCSFDENDPIALKDLFHEMVHAFASRTTEQLSDSSGVTHVATVMDILSNNKLDDLMKVVVDAVLASGNGRAMKSLMGSLEWNKSGALKHREVKRIVEAVKDIGDEDSEEDDE